MTEIKVNLSVVLQGRTMFSKEECLKTTQKVIERKSNKTGRTYKKTVDVLVDNLDMMDKNVLRVTDKGGANPEFITFYTRKCKPATKSLNISKDAYDDMTDKMSVPSWSKPYKWLSMSKKERLEAHLDRIAADFGGVSYTYQIFDD